MCALQAAIGGWHCLAVDDQGRAYAWGMLFVSSMISFLITRVRNLYLNHYTTKRSIVCIYQVSSTLNYSLTSNDHILI